ncbi:hypothetical protein DIPPA_32340 [Diplonema papillatum]|nr:hypothetical protein DIPPA_32340 [Diplonema papillatum]
MGGPRLASDHQIQLRRRQEEKLAAAELATAHDKSLRQYASWETKTHGTIKKNEFMRRVDQVQARDDDTLEKRRQRLAEMLAAEEAEYRQQLSESGETQEQRRNRIAKKALELRSERERLRKEAAQERRDRAFRQNCSQLKEYTSKALALQVAADRDEQLRWKEQRENIGKVETTFFDAISEEERLKKEARHAADVQRQKSLNRDLQDSLAQQKEVLLRKRMEAAEQERLEGEAFRSELQRGAAEDEAKERARRQRHFELGQQNKLCNVELEKLKEADNKRELDKDRQFLDDLLRKVKEDEDAERENKRNAREKSVAHMKAVERQMENAAGAETELDRLWQLKSDEEWDKREARWRQDQEKRDKLLASTFAGRAEQVEANRRARANNKQQDDEERARMINQIQQLQEKEGAQVQQRYTTAKFYQKCLAEQAAMKKEEEDAERKGKDLERLAYQLAEREYQEKVAREVSEIEARKPAQYSHLRVSRRTF